MSRPIKAMLLAVLVAVLGLWWWRKRQLAAMAEPAWTDPQQPGDGVAGEPTALTAAQSWAANRAGAMVSCCDGYTAGRRVRRLYPANLTDCPETVVRGEIGLGVTR